MKYNQCILVTILGNRQSLMTLKILSGEIVLKSLLIYLSQTALISSRKNSASRQLQSLSGELGEFLQARVFPQISLFRNTFFFNKL